MKRFGGILLMLLFVGAVNAQYTNEAQIDSVLHYLYNEKYINVHNNLLLPDKTANEFYPVYDRFQEIFKQLQREEMVLKLHINEYSGDELKSRLKFLYKIKYTQRLYLRKFHKKTQRILNEEQFKSFLQTEADFQPQTTAEPPAIEVPESFL